MKLLLLRAYLRLIQFELYIAIGNFARLHGRVRRHPTRIRRWSEEETTAICRAVDLACVLYWKPVQCLQRSAATTCLLRDHGVPAEMVIGAQIVPFRAHAWTELAGRIINDKSYIPEIYQVMERC